MEKKYNYLYKITNLINGKFYYGIHSTDNLNDGYMGSGKILHEAYKKHGIENFQKEILEFRDTREEISDLEKEIVTIDLVNNPNCYNIRLGGDEVLTLGMAVMKDKNNNIHQVPIGSDEYYNMVGVTTGMVGVYDKIENKNKSITKEEYYSNIDRYVSFSSGKIPVLINGKYTHISCEEYLKGGYQTVWFGKHHSEETKQKISKHHIETGFQQGEKNSQYGTCWITKNGENKKIKKEELDSYLNDGWIKGRKLLSKIENLNTEEIKQDKYNGFTYIELSKKYNLSYKTLQKILKNDCKNISQTGKKTKGKCWIHKDNINKMIKKEDIDMYINNGWKRGVSKNTKNNMSISSKINNCKGNKHPQYGTCWITNGKENKIVKKEDIDIYINNGWIKGRKMFL